MIQQVNIKKKTKNLKNYRYKFFLTFYNLPQKVQIDILSSNPSDVTYNGSQSEEARTRELISSNLLLRPMAKIGKRMMRISRAMHEHYEWYLSFEHSAYRNHSPLLKTFISFYCCIRKKKLNEDLYRICYKFRPPMYDISLAYVFIQSGINTWRYVYVFIKRNTSDLYLCPHLLH